MRCIVIKDIVLNGRRESTLMEIATCCNDVFDIHVHQWLLYFISIFLFIRNKKNYPTASLNELAFTFCSRFICILRNANTFLYCIIMFSSNSSFCYLRTWRAIHSFLSRSVSFNFTVNLVMNKKIKKKLLKIETTLHFIMFNMFGNFRNNLSMTFCVILHINRQTDTQMDIHDWYHDLFARMGGGNNYNLVWLVAFSQNIYSNTKLKGSSYRDSFFLSRN